MRIWIKRIGIALLIPVVLILLVSVLLYLPPVQNFAVKKATEYASKATGMQIGIERIRLSFPLNLKVQGVEVLTSPADTLLTLKSLTVNVKALPLLKKEVSVEAIDLEDAKVNTGTFIEGMEIKGILGRLHAKADNIDLAKEQGTLNSIDLSDTAITLLMNDTTTQADTTSTAINWLLHLEKINLHRVAFAMQMPADSLRMSTYIDKASLEDGIVDLGKSQYGAQLFTLTGSTLGYDMGGQLPAKGFDPSHIALSNVNISLDSLFYGGRDIRARISELSAVDRSGLTVASLTGNLVSDSTTINVPQLLLKTPSSEARLLATVPWSSFDDDPAGNMRVMLTASLGKEDVMIFAGDLPEDFQKAYPQQPVKLTAGVEGNLSSLMLRQLKAELPGAFSMNASGTVKAVTDSLRRSGKLDLKAETGNLDFILSMLPASERSRYNIPAGITLTGTAGLSENAYQADLLLKEDKGRVTLTGLFNPATEAYAADLKVDSLEPIHFLPLDSLYYLSATIRAEGQGFDPFNAATHAKLDGKLTDIRYGNYNVEDITLDGSLEKNFAKFDLLSKYPLAKMDLTLNATLKEKDINAMLIADVDNFDLYGMHLMTDSLATSFQLFAEARSDMGKNNRVDVTLGNWELITSIGTYKPKTLTLHAQSTKDTTQVSFHAGDLGIVLTGNSDLETMTDKFSKISEGLNKQLEKDTMINIPAFQPLLPDMHLAIKAGKDNPIYNMLQQAGVSFNHLALEAFSSPEEGFRMDAGVYDLMRDTTRIDTITFAVRQDSLGLLYNAGVAKTKYRQQAPFTAGVKGQIRNTYADAEFVYTDGAGDTGILLGLRADKEKEGFKIHLFPDDPILAFRPFKLNPDNYILYKNLKDIAANVRLTGDKNASLWIHSQPHDEGMEEVHLELSQIDLDVISQAFAEIPAMKGILSADLQYAPSDSSFLVVVDANIDNLIYEGGRVGELMFSTVYLPLDDNTHQVDLHLMRDQSEVMAATALYKMGKNDYLDGTLDIMHLPLDMVNPFIPDNMASLSGALEGNMTIKGSSKAPAVNGFIEMDSTQMFVTAVGSTFSVDDKKIVVKDNQVIFDEYHIHAAGKNPFVIDGTIDFKNPSRMMADLKLNADNMQLLDVKRNKESLVYGKLLVNLGSTVKGPLDALVMRGSLQVLGGTDVTYVLKDSPLTVQDRMSGLVTFTSFQDTLLNRRREAPLPLGGLDMLLTIRIDQSVRLNADLTPDRSSKVELEGGGDLSFQYTPQGEMILNGRYTLSGGIVKYALPVIPLKEFNIQDGSYVQWSGDVMDPYLSLTATERIRANVTLDGQNPRMVNFDVGIALKQQLENLSLQFVMTAPEDQAMQTQLSSMGEDERTKLAVGMIMTGMYLANSGSGKQNLNMGAALNSFLNSEISNIAGSALKTVDISFGMDTYDANGDGTGGQRTDYNFSFAKRFWNDRIRVVLGGRISTGENASNSNQTQAFIDNVSVEYRLDASGTRYVKLFHDKNYESLLEGEITETGVGIVLRRKMLHLRELFNFKKNKTKPVNEEEK